MVIKSMLQDMRLVLCNNNLKSDYHVSKRGVPYVSVFIGGFKFTFVYFKRKDIFRIFDPLGNKFEDIKTRNNVIDYFINLYELTEVKREKVVKTKIINKK